MKIFKEIAKWKLLHYASQKDIVTSGQYNSGEKIWTLLINIPGWEEIKFLPSETLMKQLVEDAKTIAVYIGQVTKNLTNQVVYIYLYKNGMYYAEVPLSQGEAATVINHQMKKKENMLLREVERIKAKAEAEGAIRTRIPENVQVRVWNRDSGKCVSCGNNEKLEFDHIIPVSKGGSNTARNIQLLCEKCNREKSNKIGG